MTEDEGVRSWRHRRQRRARLQTDGAVPATHGGEIRAENREDGGAAFLFTLPRARTGRKKV